MNKHIFMVSLILKPNAVNTVLKPITIKSTSNLVKTVYISENFNAVFIQKRIFEAYKLIPVATQET